MVPAATPCLRMCFGKRRAGIYHRGCRNQPSLCSLGGRRRCARGGRRCLRGYYLFLVLFILLMCVGDAYLTYTMLAYSINIKRGGDVPNSSAHKSTPSSARSSAYTLHPWIIPVRNRMSRRGAVSLVMFIIDWMLLIERLYHGKC